jgi:hypothetical protein
MKRGDGGEFEASKLYIILIGELISDLTMSAATSRATRRATRRATTSATTRAEGRDARLNESPSRRPGDVNKSGDGGGGAGGIDCPHRVDDNAAFKSPALTRHIAVA